MILQLSESGTSVELDSVEDFMRNKFFFNHSTGVMGSFNTIKQADMPHDTSILDVRPPTVAKLFAQEPFRLREGLA